MVFAKLVPHNLVERQHVCDPSHRFPRFSGLGPPQPVAVILDVHFLGYSALQLNFNTLIAAFFSHPAWDGPTLFLDHRQLLQVLVRVKEQLASIQFNHDARHGPNV